VSLRDSTWIVVTADGLFMRRDGGIATEYPDACLFARESLARRAARDARDLGPYSVLTTEEYAQS
jgi:hypothetical protein